MEAMENWQEDEAPPLLEDEIEVFEGEDERDDPSTLPLGFRFCPSDEEIITNYLIPKVRRTPLACEWVVIDVELYKFSPMVLTGLIPFSLFLVSWCFVLMMGDALLQRCMQTGGMMGFGISSRRGTGSMRRGTGRTALRLRVTGRPLKEI